MVTVRLGKSPVSSSTSACICAASARPLSMMCERSWQSREVPEAWPTAAVPPALKRGKKRDPGSYKRASGTSRPGKLMEQSLPEALSKDVEAQKVTGSSRHGFTMRR